MHKQLAIGFQYLGYMGRWIYHQKIMSAAADMRVNMEAIEATFQEEIRLAETHFERMRAYDHRRMAMFDAVREYSTCRDAIQRELDTRVC